MRSTLLAASLIAADLASPDGFMLRDVRFFFLLFRNWLEADVRDPEHDIDLTQIRRALEQLARRRQVRAFARRRRRGRMARARHALTLAGILALADDLVAWSPRRSFEEGLFAILFATAYRDQVTRRAERAGAPVARRRLARALDPSVIATAIARALARQRADLEDRIAGGDKLLAAAIAARREGVGDAELVRRLERMAPYRLQHVRPLGELLMSLPADLRDFEVSDGIVARRELVFRPLLRLTLAQEALIADLVR